MTLIQEVALDNTIVVQFFDQSNRYFGDYNKVSILVKVTSLNDRNISYQQVLDQMAVPTHKIDAVRKAMIDSYLANTKGYLVQPDFLRKARLRNNNKVLPNLYRYE